MSVSVLVIAHNEENYIRSCLQSVHSQTKKPDEVIVIAHNCTDKTAAYAREFTGVRVIEFQSEQKGALYARIKGFHEIIGDVVACIDGDSHASPRWLERITQPFSSEQVAATGGVVWFDGLLANLATVGFFFLDPLFRPTYHFYFWGANFAVRKSMYNAVGGLKPLITLKEKLSLYLTPDDAYLSCALMQAGKVVRVKHAPVYSDNNFFRSGNIIKKKGYKQNADRLVLFKYFKLIT